MNDPLLTPADLEARWRHTFKIRRATLANWRSNPKGQGPDFIRRSNRILYPLSAVEHYEATGEHRAPGGGYPSLRAATGPMPRKAARSAAGADAVQAPSAPTDRPGHEAPRTLERKWARLAIHSRRRIVESAGRDLLRCAGGAR